MRKYICMVVLGIFDRLNENVVKKIIVYLGSLKFWGSKGVIDFSLSTTQIIWHSEKYGL
jgi:hypothetical protein